MDSNKNTIANSLSEHFEHVLSEHEKRRNDSELSHCLMQLAQWQSERLVKTYDDLINAPRYRQAMLFFKEDMYAPKDFSQRDMEAHKVLPMMKKIVPNKMLSTLSAVMELNALTMDLDHKLAMQLKEQGDIEQITEQNYAHAYRECDNYTERQYQIDLLVRLGQQVGRYVKMPYISMTLKMMTGPANVMGLGHLHDFFERGYAGFKKMGDTREFLRYIEQRETKILNNIYDSKSNPFDI